jgi:hypothetical protein
MAMKEKIESADSLFVQDFESRWDLYVVRNEETELIHSFLSLDDIYRFLHDYLGTSFSFTVHANA